MFAQLKRMTCLAVLLLALGSVQAEDSGVLIDGVEEGKPTQDYAAALAYAKENDQAVMLLFTGSDWCGWCKLMDKDVFSKPEWTEFATGKLVQVVLDFPRKKPDLVPEKYRKRNQELKQEYGVRGFPTYVLLDSNGDRLGQLGAGRGKTPASFQEEVEDLLVMTDDGMERFVATMKEEDAKAIKTAFAEFKVSKTKAEEAETVMEAAQDEAAKKHEVLMEAMETGKVNNMTPEEKAAYEDAKKEFEAVKAEFEAWVKENGRKQPTPELNQQFQALRKKIQDADAKLKTF